MMTASDSPEPSFPSHRFQERENYSNPTAIKIWALTKVKQKMRAFSSEGTLGCSIQGRGGEMVDLPYDP